MEISPAGPFMVVDITKMFPYSSLCKAKKTLVGLNSIYKDWRSLLP